MKPEDENNKNKKPFTFDWDSLNEWVYQYIEGIVQESEGVWVVGGNQKNKETKPKLIHWKNNNGEEIWKVSYFIKSELDIEYRSHLISNALHTLEQPSYYKGMFEILN
jgi:hypothetical protein